MDALDDLIVETGEPGSDECQPGQDAAHDNRYRGCDAAAASDREPSSTMINGSMETGTPTRLPNHAGRERSPCP